MLCFIEVLNLVNLKFHYRKFVIIAEESGSFLIIFVLVSND